MNSLEIEKTYLVKYLPGDLKSFPSKEVIDIYIPLVEDHPRLRLRKRGDIYEMTKKTKIKADDPASLMESTITLSEEEFSALRNVGGKVIRKMRYYYPYLGKTAEIDVFMDGLEGLAVTDVEFYEEAEMDGFSMPEFCLVDVTKEKFLAGGRLAGKRYADIEKELERLGYKKING